MEALLEREGQVENWNDERLDELNRRMDAGFERAATKEEVNLRFNEVDRRFDKVDHELGRINDRLDKLTYTILGVFGAFAATTVAAVIGNAIL